ncbi:hypothetical protein [Marinobacter phage PS6]|nr:hypothetical protein [Marinobacter phage PS6]
MRKTKSGTSIRASGQAAQNLFDALTGGIGKTTVSCPECDDTGVVHEGGMSMNPEVDNQVPCPQCKKERVNG